MATQEIADQIEQEISATNELLYFARFDLAQIDRGLQDEIKFDLTDVKRVFSSAQAIQDGKVLKSYN